MPYSLLVTIIFGSSYFGSIWAHLLSGVLSIAGLLLALRAPRLDAGESLQAKDQKASHRLRRRDLLMAGSTAMCFPIAYGWQVERTQLEVSSYDIAMPNLPASLVGLKIAVLSDWHCGPYTPQDYLLHCMEVVNRSKPDLILMPGDFVLIHHQYFGRAAELIARLHSQVPGGILATWGNHDHVHGIQHGLPKLEKAGARLLSNQSLRLTPEKTWSANLDGPGLLVGGAEDLWFGHCDLEQTLRGAHSKLPRLVMAHNPDTAEHQPQHQIDLMVSGHTHGGQLRLPLIGSPLVPSDFGDKYLHGLVQAPGYPVLVTRGLGVSGLPMRLGSPPELAILSLKAHGQNESSSYSEKG